MLELTDVEIDELTSTIFKTAQIDFRNYAKSSLKRRLTRFSEMHSLQSYEALTQHILNLSNRNEFIEAITVNTTEMFRDPSFWIALREQILPELSKNETINIWHAGCSTGEEVISMQILLEEMGLRNKVHAKASDLNLAVLKQAKQASFKSKNLAICKSNYYTAGGTAGLEKYVESQNDATFTFDQKLLSNVEFKAFDLVQDTSYKKFDLILCRNVLIYFDFALQESVLLKFIASSHRNAFIAIGQQESIINGNLLQYLQVANEAEKIYRLH